MNYLMLKHCCRVRIYKDEYYGLNSQDSLCIRHQDNKCVANFFYWEYKYAHITYILSGLTSVHTQAYWLEARFFKVDIHKDLAKYKHVHTLLHPKCTHHGLSTIKQKRDEARFQKTRDIIKLGSSVSCSPTGDIFSLFSCFLQPQHFDEP